MGTESNPGQHHKLSDAMVVSGRAVVHNGRWVSGQVTIVQVVVSGWWCAQWSVMSWPVAAVVAFVVVMQMVMVIAVVVI
jgi:hypothetical protein